MLQSKKVLGLNLTELLHGVCMVSLCSCRSNSGSPEVSSNGTFTYRVVIEGILFHLIKM